MKNKVVKNATWIIVCRIIQAILSVVVTMISARYLGPSGYGIINYAASLVAFVAPIMKLGLDSVLVQALVNTPNKEGKVMGTTLVLSFVSGLFCMLGIFAFVSVTNANDKTTIIVCLLYSVCLLFQALELMQYWFQAKLKSKCTSIVSLVAYFVVSIYKICLLIFGCGIYWFAISQAIDYLIISVVLIFIYSKQTDNRLSFSLQTAKELFSKSKYYIVSSLMVTIFANTDKIMINLMMGESYTGFYSAAVTCASMTAFVFGAIIDSSRPGIFENKAKSQQEFEKSVSKLYSIIIYLSLCQCVVITIFSPLIIDILYGAEYELSISALRIIVWYTTFAYLGSIRNIWILAENKQKYLWILNLSGALLNIILNYFLIPVHGIEGAAFASLLTQVFTNVIMNIVVYPIRKNNLLMFKGLNPKLLAEMIKEIK